MLQSPLRPPAAPFAVLLVLAASVPSRADDLFRERIVPFVSTYCAECHNAKSAEAELNLTRYTSAEMAAADFRQWEHVATFLEREEMPPETASKQPSPELRSEILKTVRRVLATEARRMAGDPGVVLPRRLSNAEYDHTIRDLTGVDIRPTRSFPVDPAAGEGFDNTGEALAMSPSLFSKLYAAAQHVADHALLTTDGLEFAPYPVITFEDRKKFYEQAILSFYEGHKIDLENCLAACWEFRHRPAARRDATIEMWAAQHGLSPKYLRSLHEMLEGTAADGFYVGWLRRRWVELPAPVDPAAPGATGATRDAIRRLADDIQSLSRSLCPRETEAIVSNAGNGPVQHLERRRRTAVERDTFDPKGIAASRRLHRTFRNLDKAETVKIALVAAPFGNSGEKPGDGFAVLKSMTFSTASPDSYRPNDEKRNLPLRKLLVEFAPDQAARIVWGTHPQGDPIDADGVVVAAPGSLELDIPAKAFGDAREIHLYVEAELDRRHTKSGLLSVELLEGKPAASGGSLPPATLLVDPEHPAARAVAASGEAFCRVFPNRFFYVDGTRGLSAGFHLIEGFFRDDRPLCRSVLNDAENRDLDRLWTELEFVTEIAERMLRGFVFFERSERNFLKHADFDPFKEEDPKLVEAETLARFERVYLDRSNVKGPIEELAAHPIHIFFEQIRDGLRRRQEGLGAASPIYLQQIEAFAKSAYRRPLSPKEVDELRAFYRQIAEHEKFGIEQAVRASLVRILMSPHFGCRIDPAPEGDTVAPLSDLALASRLSYFLWASMPDAELLELAEAGKLRDEAALLVQTRRMLQDPKVEGFAREFFGQWLGYRDFPQQESVDREAFRDFDEPLKEAMFEEPTKFAARLIRRDRPITELLDGDETLVNARLARHYGVSFPSTGDAWAPIDNLRGQGRGGILGMAVFLTKNSQPQRTSPVKRGFWVVHKVLGEHIPAPPADVVALPAKETDTNGKTVRELLKLHVEDAKCARCHVRFDAVGLAMEGFDPIGRRRSKDLAGRPVDDVVRLTDGSEARGLPDFAAHLVKSRRDDFVRTFCRKLLGYALGRSLVLSDEVLIEEMRAALDRNGDRAVGLFETIVRSPQFRNQRRRDFSVARFRSENS